MPRAPRAFCLFAAPLRCWHATPVPIRPSPPVEGELQHSWVQAPITAVVPRAESGVQVPLLPGWARGSFAALGAKPAMGAQNATGLMALGGQD